ncbi:MULTISPECIES: phage tail spike protein [unclassified Facklamia]|uniref:phage tail spike protein n=1 Tax=Aerococcaceae TaxID=186827 RepID=UPI0013D364BE|nr:MULTISPECIES: phage tail spike protein [unclassified Facklamia]QQD66147.1 phage tail protein [Aerococcaceae bacterium zg-252]
MIYLFNNQEQLIKILTDKIVKSAYHTQELTDENYISDKLIVEVKAMDDVELAEVEYIGISSLNKDHAYDLFYVLSHKTVGTITEFIGVQSGIEELRKIPVYDIRPNGSVRQHAERIIQGSNWTVGYTPDIGNAGVNYYYMSAFDALKKMCNSFGVEMQFHVEINGNKIGNRYIEFKKRIGTVTHRRVTYGHNALEIIKEVQKANLVTALIGRGRGEEVSSAGENESGQAGYGRKITFEDIVWEKSQGKPVDKPAGLKYVENKEATAMFGIKTPNGNIPKIGFIEFDTDDRELLLQRTYESLNEQCRPQVLFRTTSAYLTAEIGDTVRVERPDLNIDYAVRVVKIEWNRISNRAISLELGDKLNDSLGSQMKSLSKDIENRLADEIMNQKSDIVDHILSANGFNTNWYSETEPTNPRINDIWYQPDPEFEGHYIMRIWNGEIWEELVRTKNFNRVIEKIKQVEDHLKTTEAEIEKIHARNEEELEKFREELKSLDLSEEKIEAITKKINLELPDFDALKSQIESVRESSRVNAEMIGNDGKTRYSKNILIGEVDRKLLFTDDHITIEANDGGFKKGQTYTISFEALCELLAKAKVSFNFGREAVRGVTMTLTPSSSKLTTVQTGSKTVDVLPGDYTVLMTSGWYKRYSQEVRIEKDTTIDILTEYREIAEGNRTMAYQGEWSENPELILDGGVS